MPRKKYLAKNTALFALNSIGTRIISFLLVPLYTNAFHTAEFGGVDLVSAISTIFVPIITLNIGEAVMRFSLDDDSDKKSIVRIGVFFAMLSLLWGTGIFLILRLFPQIVVNPLIVGHFCYDRFENSRRMVFDGLDFLVVPIQNNSNS